ncbi:MAG TPA: hypothetical protein VFR29_04985 [Steroidobacteraceae bacterium]|nr:hypothetical protein [Steroidobacteraceae bacterium]
MIRQYLAGSLSEKDLRMVETRIVEDPEFRNEVELTQALRQGLRELQKRGEIAPLLSPRRAFWSPPRVALAASLATVALGAASFLFFLRPDPAAPGVVTETLYFVQTRSAGFEPDVTWRQPRAPRTVELRFDVGLEPAPAYGVTVERVRGQDTDPVLSLDAVTTDDGEAIVALDGALLKPGDYELNLVPRQTDRDLPTVHYTLRVTRS